MMALKMGLGWILGIAFIVIWAEIASLLLAKHRPRVRSRFWNLTFLLALALPIVFLAPSPIGPDPTGIINTVFFVVARGSAGVVERTPIDLAAVVLTIWGIVALIRVVRLARGLYQLSALTRAARPIQVEHEAPFPVLETKRVATPSASFLGSAVLVPPSFTHLPEYWRRAVIEHESIHLQRGHGYAIIVEELVRCFFWFHPLMSHLISRVRDAREQLVDAETVERLGNHAEYRELLIALATNSPSLAPAVSGAQSLCGRLRSLTSLEKQLMPNLPHARVLCAVLAMFGTTVSAYEIASSAVLGQSESTAKKDGGKKPAAAERVKTVNVNPIYPEALKEKKVSALFLLDVAVSAEGDVTEVSELKSEKLAKADPEFIRAAIDAVRQWKYLPGDKATRMTVAMNFRPASTEPR